MGRLVEVFALKKRFDEILASGSELIDFGVQEVEFEHIDKRRSTGGPWEFIFANKAIAGNKSSRIKATIQNL